MADRPVRKGAAARLADREMLKSFRRVCEEQSQAIRARDEWLQAARERLWERRDRMAVAQTPPASAEDGAEPAGARDTDAVGENGAVRPPEG